MADLADPGRSAIEADLRSFRKGSGAPTEARLGGLFDLTEALGAGILERAFTALGRYYETHGVDPETDIGAYFYLAGWGVSGHSIDQRRRWYRDAFLVDISTAWRRAERGLKQLAALIRDHSEHSRPWAVISVFQTGDNFQAFLDFNLGHEAWRMPAVYLNGDEVENIDFHLHVADGSDPQRRGPGTRYVSRVVLPEVPLNLSTSLEQSLASVRVTWDMPVWPVWQALGWTVNPDIYVRTRTFRQRAVEVALWRASDFNM